MADFYVWTRDELGLDIEKMDQEHQELIRKMNVLYKGHEEKLDSQQIMRLLEELAMYTTKHFGDEEDYLESIQFPGLETHRLIHQHLVGQLNEHLNGFKKTNKLENSFFSFLKVWLTGHIKGIDKKYSEFYKLKKVS